MRSTPPMPYADSLLSELDAIADAYAEVLRRSPIRVIDPNRRGGVMFIGYPKFDWTPSDPELEALRMVLLTRVRDWAKRFQFLFLNPTAQIAERHDDAIRLLENWLERGTEHRKSVPDGIEAAQLMLDEAVNTLRAARGSFQAMTSRRDWSWTPTR